ncbi:MAG: guanylate kinase [Acidobacteriota bacterium]|jgi:guanylate kinase|nr:guanylate kinase [Acidobacteriota bacterium]
MSNKPNRPAAAGDGNLVIVSGPSGAGKSALTTHALGALPDIKFSVSYTTRSPRGAERSGVEYFFVSRREFEALRDAGEFLEWAEVHGNLYGTSQNFIDALLRQGMDVILDIDVQGAGIIKKKRPDAIAVLVLPPSFDVLRERLRRRGLDGEAVIEKRLGMARDEISHYPDYDYLIVNDDLGRAERELDAIILAARCRMDARKHAAASILEHFGGLNV